MGARKVVRWLALAAGLAIAAWPLQELWSNFQGWRADVEFDPSVAELYYDNCLIAGSEVVASLGVALAFFFLLGRAETSD
jgi:hypothetical protein